MTPLALLLVLAFLVSVSLGVTAGSAGLAMTSYALAYASGSPSTARCSTTSAASQW